MQNNDILDKLKKIEQQILSLSSDIQHLKDNHIHHLDIRMTKMETSLSIGWKAVLVGAGIPAIISAILSVIQVIK